MYRATILSLSQ